MSTQTTHLDLTKPETTDGFDTAEIASNWQKVDDHPGVLICTTATRPGSPWTGQMVYDTDLPSYLCWDGSAWVPPEVLTPMAKLVRTGGQSIADDTPDYVEFNVEERITWGMADVGTDDEIITIAVTTDYHLTAGAHYLEGNATGYREIWIELNGTDILAADNKNAITGVPTKLSIGTSARLSTGDVLRLGVHHTDGDALSVGSATAAEKTTYLSAVAA